MRSILWEEGGIMIDGNAREFINKLYYEDHYIIFDKEKYFLNGCQTKRLDNGSELVTLEVYNLTQDITVFSVTKPTATECVSVFQDTPIFNGKSFWEVESEITWTDD